MERRTGDARTHRDRHVPGGAAATARESCCAMSSGQWSVCGEAERRGARLRTGPDGIKLSARALTAVNSAHGALSAFPTMQAQFRRHTIAAARASHRDHLENASARAGTEADRRGHRGRGNTAA